MRLNQNEIRNAVRGAAGMTDREFFTCPSMMEFFNTFIAGVCEALEASIKVRLMWVEDGPIAMASDKREVTLNAENEFTAGKDRVTRFTVLKGLALHESGHILFTNYSLLKDRLIRLIKTGTLIPEDDRPEILKVQELLNAMPGLRITAAEMLKQIDNTIEDGYIESVLLELCRGYARNLTYLRQEQSKGLPSWDEMTAEGLRIDAILFNGILAYAKYGTLLLQDGDTREGADVYFDILNDIRDAVSCHDTQSRAKCANRIFAKVLLYLIEQAQSQQSGEGGEGDSQQEGQEGSGQGESSGSGGQNGGSSGDTNAQPGGGDSNGSNGQPDNGSNGPNGQPDNGSNDANGQQGDGSSNDPGQDQNGGNSNGSGQAQNGGSKDPGKDQSGPSEGSQNGGSNASGESQNSGGSNTAGGANTAGGGSQNGNGKSLEQAAAEALRRALEGTDRYSSDEMDPGSIPDQMFGADPKQKALLMSACTNGRQDGQKDEVQPSDTGKLDEILNAEKKRATDDASEKAIMKELEDIRANMPDNKTSCQITRSEPGNAGVYDRMRRDLSPIAKRMQAELIREIDDKRTGSSMKRLYSGRRLDISGYCQQDGKAFSKNVLPEDFPDMSVMILIDMSGSMHGAKEEAAMETAFITYDFCRRLNIPVSVYGHRVLMRGTVDMVSFAEFDSIDGKDARRLASISSGGCNRDGYALRFCAEHLDRQESDTKILFVISDGRPSAYVSAEEALADMHGVLEEYSKKGIIFITAGIADDNRLIRCFYSDGMNPKYAAHFLDITDLKRLPKQFVRIIKKRLEKDI